MAERTIVAIHQPNYLPYLGFFHKMSLADIFVLYDTAQYSKNEFHNRNRIKTPSGVQWLSVPVRTPTYKPIRDVEIDATKPWRRGHMRTLRANYARATEWETYEDDLESIYQEPWKQLARLNLTCITQIAKWLGIETPLVVASSIPMPDGMGPTDRIIELVRRVGGDAYLSGGGAGAYLDSAAFTDIQLLLQDFKHPKYRQPWGPFVENLSAIDVILNSGEGARSLLANAGRLTPWHQKTTVPISTPRQ